MNGEEIDESQVTRFLNYFLIANIIGITTSLTISYFVDPLIGIIFFIPVILIITYFIYRREI